MCCERCGHENPVENYFCGHCGTPLLHRNNLPVEPVRSAVTGSVEAGETVLLERQRGGSPPRNGSEAERSSPSEPAVPVVSGPSFLGLAETEANSNLDYLYEEPPRHRGALWVAVLILAAGGSFLAYQRKQIPVWYAAIVKQVTVKRQNMTPVQQVSTDRSNVSAPLAQATETPTQANQAPPPNTQAPAPAIPGNNQVKESPPGESAAQTAGGVAGAIAGRIPIPPVDATVDQKSGVTSKAALSPTSSTLEPTTSQPRSATGVPPAPTDSTSGSRAVTPRDEGSDLFKKGQAYLYGNGVPTSCIQALAYLRKSADLGNAQAQGQLGVLYATGHCLPVNRARAYYWLSQAAEASHSRNVWIERNRQNLWDEMTEAERRQARAYLE